MTVDTIDPDELQRILGEAEREQKLIESDGLLHVGRIVLPKELPVFDEEFYEWKRTFWSNRIKEDGIRYVVAPMVDQSELAFRMMMRKNNAQLFFTPMVHAQLFVTNHTYRRTAISTTPEDRPLIVQFCANDPDIFLDACRLVEGFCDGVDLNCGCPQGVAKRGHYGAFLQEEPELIARMVAKVHKHCRLPISVKIRVLEDVNDAVNYARVIENAGASMLTVHGRLREQKGPNTGVADWNKIKQIQNALRIPVVANGNIQMPGDADMCMTQTGTVAVMSAEGLLSNPYLFRGVIRPCYEVTDDYLNFADKYKAPLISIRAHVFRFCHHALTELSHLRIRIASVSSIEDFREVVQKIREHYEEQARGREDGLRFLDGTETTLVEATKKIPAYFSKPYVRPPKRDVNDPESDYRAKQKQEFKRIQLETGLSLRRIKRRERKKLNVLRAENRKAQYPLCTRCKQPSGKNCSNCRKCCRSACIREMKTCLSHQFSEAIIAPMRTKYRTLSHPMESHRREYGTYLQNLEVERKNMNISIGGLDKETTASTR